MKIYVLDQIKYIYHLGIIIILAFWIGLSVNQQMKAINTDLNSFCYIWLFSFNSVSHGWVVVTL